VKNKSDMAAYNPLDSNSCYPDGEGMGVYRGQLSVKKTLALCVTGGESTPAGNEEIMSRLRETPDNWKGKLSSSSAERDMFLHCISGLCHVC
jgi:hypothetical protein